MQAIIEELQEKFQAEPLAPSHEGKLSDSVYLRIDQTVVPDVMTTLENRGVILIAEFAVENFEGGGFSLLYVFERRGDAQILTLVVRLKECRAVSVAVHFPNACYFEREITDGFGIEFEGAFDARRLFLHDIYPDGFHPLLKSVSGSTVATSTVIARKEGTQEADTVAKSGSAAQKSLRPMEPRLPTTPKKEYVFRECSGEGVYQIPVGPVHAGIIEPGHFRFSVIGETIFNLEIRHFYTHRGLEKLAEGKTPLECAAVAESVSGDESAANAVAFAIAVEDICQLKVPQRSWGLRTILLELERVYSHLGDLAGMVTDVAYPLGAAAFFNLREEVLRQNAALTGSRFSKGIIVPGGLKRDIAQSKLAGLAACTNDFVGRLEDAVSAVNASGWVIDRFETTGVIKKELVAPLNLTGPTARACGVHTDIRIGRPYGIYEKLRVEEFTREGGDVLARFYVKADEIKNSVRMIQDVLDQVRGGPVSTEFKIRDGFGMGLVEAARGQNLHWVYLEDGRVSRYKVRTASFCNWPAIEHAVMGNIVADFPVINKSLNLSYAGNDL